MTELGAFIVFILLPLLFAAALFFTFISFMACERSLIMKSLIFSCAMALTAMKIAGEAVAIIVFFLVYFSIILISRFIDYLRNKKLK